MSENSLIIFTKASQMLAEANTIQKAKELKDLALTAQDWAKRKNMGSEAIQYAHSYAIQAEIRLGELLKETERNPAGRPAINKSPQGTNFPPTLADLGISKKESSEAQLLASLPQEIIESVVSGSLSKKEAKKKMREISKTKEREIIALSGSKMPESEKWKVELADIKEYQTNQRFDFIITDPPYAKEHLGLYETLAIKSASLLKDSGLLITMCGQSYINQIYYFFDKYLKYYWTGCYLLPGQPTPLRQRQINCSWKPILIYCLKESKYNGKIFGDIFKSDKSDKNHHDWGQSESGMLSIISMICMPGQSIFDPFCGSGTTGVAAKKFGCTFLGIDIDINNVNISRKRLHDCKA